MSNSLFRAEIRPFLSLFLALLLATLLGDYLLHRFDLVSVGRYLGIPGTLLIVASLAYSLKKRRIIRSGTPQTLLKLHELFTWMGALMIFIHAGVHFNAVLPWLATLALIVNVVSGLVGRRLLNRARRHVASLRQTLRQRGLSDEAIDKELFWDAVTLEQMTRWRTVHFPISYGFAFLAVAHIVTILLFWEWR
ncbi:MAG: hypothetical protein HQL56_13640 [Magnetococcales bacterium]|nr:hypothetical protein [Magnetococcales bacterium]